MNQSHLKRIIKSIIAESLGTNKHWDITIDEFQFNGKNFEVNANVDRVGAAVGHRQLHPDGPGEDEWGQETEGVNEIEIVEWDESGNETPVDVGSPQNRQLVDAATSAVMDKAADEDSRAPSQWGKPRRGREDPEDVYDRRNEPDDYDPLEEMSTTGGVGGYQTPNAFQGSGDADRKKKLAQKSMPGGKVVGESDDPDEKTADGRLPIVRQKTVSEGRGRYANFKNSDIMKAHAKVSYGIKEAHTMLKEVEFLLNICERFKTESGVSSNSLWKRTKPDIKNIHSRLKEIASRINRLNK